MLTYVECLGGKGRGGSVSIAIAIKLNNYEMTIHYCTSGAGYAILMCNKMYLFSTVQETVSELVKLQCTTMTSHLLLGQQYSLPIIAEAN